MNPSLTTVATFSIGVFCGYLLRKNWYILHALLGGKRNKTIKDPKNEIPKETIEELDTTAAPSVSKKFT